MGAHNDILADLKTTLEGINGSGSYTIAMDTVELLAKDADTTKAGLKPWAGIAHVNTTLRNEHGRNFRAAMDLRIIVHVDAASAAARGTTADNIIDDVLLALYTDIHRDNNAINTTVTTIETDEAQPDAGKSITVMFHIIVHYMRTYTT